MEALRGRTRPMSGRDVTLAIMASRGLAVNDGKLVETMRLRVGGGAAHHEGARDGCVGRWKRAGTDLATYRLDSDEAARTVYRAGQPILPHLLLRADTSRRSSSISPIDQGWTSASLSAREKALLKTLATVFRVCLSVPNVK